MVQQNYKRVLILEDDARFVINFKSIFVSLMSSMQENSVEWELLYLGRKIMRQHAREEVWNTDIPSVKGHGVIKPAYSHWTIAYALTQDGILYFLNEE